LGRLVDVASLPYQIPTFKDHLRMAQFGEAIGWA